MVVRSNLKQGIIDVLEKMQSATALSRIDPQMLLQRLSYPHIEAGLENFKEILSSCRG